MISRILSFGIQTLTNKRSFVRKIYRIEIEFAQHISGFWNWLFDDWNQIWMQWTDYRTSPRHFLSKPISDRMPKRKTGQRKKAEKQKERQKLLQSAYNNKQLVECPCNFLMVCA